MNKQPLASVPSESELLAQMQEKLRSNPFLLLASYVVKLRYTLWLALLREVSIYRTLMENYESIPKNTRTYKLVSLLVRYPKLKETLLNVEKRLRKRIY